MGLSCAQNLLLGLCIVFAFMCTSHITVCARRRTIKKSERLNPPLDIQLHTVNCTAFRVQWKMPWRSTRAISGYKVFYTEMNTLPVSRTVTLEVPLNLDMPTTGHFDGQASFDVVVGKLKVATPYRVSVGAYGRAGDSHPSMPKDISTASHEICIPPSPPTQPLVVAISDTELALSWQQNESEESAPVLYFLVAYIRPEMDTEWTYIREPVESNTMVLKGLVPETEHQFVVRSVNAHGTSPPSSISSPVHTLRTADVGSGDIYITNFEDKYGFDSDDSDYDIFIEELKPFPVVSTNSRRSQLRARIGSPVNADVIYRMRNTPDPRNTPTPQNTNFTSNFTIWTTPGPWMATTATSSPTTNTATTAISTIRSTPNITTTTIDTPSNNPIPTTTTTTTDTPSNSPIPTATSTTPAAPSNNPIPTATTTTSATPSNNPIPTTATTTPATHSTSPIPTRSVPSIVPTTPSSSPPRVKDVSCDKTVCPHYSFCTDDHRGGSRCHCNLGYQGDRCSEDVTVKFPRFYGYSHMTFEPLKNSYLHFHITLEFKADSKDGLLLYCGENVDGRGDFTSLALIGAKLHYRFNCGTGAAQIVSESSVVIGQWHVISLFREGVNGWMRLDNDAPVSGSSQGHYTKITFRTPLYVGGAPTTYRLVRTVGTNQGFQGCVQSLSINSKSTSLRPWPHGEALAGADIGECSSSVCDEVTCLNGGVCSPTRADSYICLCSLGYRGDHCEESFVLSLPQFNESLHSYASAPWPLSSSSYLSFMEFHITFRPVSKDGTLLYTHDSASPDFLSISLVGGFVEVRFDCGSGAAIIRSEKTVSMNSWHELHVSRTAKNGILQVDDHQPVEGSAEGAFTQIRCSSPLYIGGVPDDVSKRSMGVLQGFTGAVQKITLNDHAVAMTLGVNVLNALHPCVENPCANGGTCRPQRDGYDCDCRLGYDGKHCQKECGNYCLNTVTENIEIPQFTGRSYLTYDNPHILKRVSGSRTNMFIRFKSTSKDGLLLWRGESSMRVNSDYLSLGLQNGALVFSFNLGSGAAVVEVNGTFSDGKWHRVKAVREGPFGKLTVDDYGSKTGRSTGKMRQLNINGVLYVGGMKEIVLHTSRHHHRGLVGLVGCISHFTLATDFHVALVDDATDGKNINTCTN